MRYRNMGVTRPAGFCICGNALTTVTIPCFWETILCVCRVRPCAQVLALLQGVRLDVHPVVDVYYRINNQAISYPGTVVSVS
jgi:hypothetical protein